MKPMAMPIAAKIPANLAMSKVLVRAVAGFSPLVALSAEAVSFSADLAFFSAALLSILSLIHLATFL